MEVTPEAPYLAPDASPESLPSFPSGPGLGPDIIPAAFNGSITGGPIVPPGIKEESNGTAEAESRENRAKAKQKRNKPTLSCLECVERK